MAKEKAKHDGLLCFLLALIVVLILVIGGGAYYFFVVDNGEEIAENNLPIVEDNKNEIDLEYSVSKTIKKEGKFNIELPKLVGTTDGIKEINKKIDLIYDKYTKITDLEISISYEIYTSKYNGKNILDINIWVDKSIGPADAGNNLYSYHYNIDNGKEFTLQDIIEEENYSLSDMNKEYKVYLDEQTKMWGTNSVKKAWDYVITGNEMYYISHDGPDNEEADNYLSVVLKEEDGYISMNEKPYRVIYSYKVINNYVLRKGLCEIKYIDDKTKQFNSLDNNLSFQIPSEWEISSKNIAIWNIETKPAEKGISISISKIENIDNKELKDLIVLENMSTIYDEGNTKILNKNAYYKHWSFGDSDLCIEAKTIIINPNSNDYYKIEYLVDSNVYLNFYDENISEEEYWEIKFMNLVETAYQKYEATFDKLISTLKF